MLIASSGSGPVTRTGGSSRPSSMVVSACAVDCTRVSNAGPAPAVHEIAQQLPDPGFADGRRARRARAAHTRAMAVTAARRSVVQVDEQGAISSVPGRLRARRPRTAAPPRRRPGTRARSGSCCACPGPAARRRRGEQAAETVQVGRGERGQRVHHSVADAGRQRGAHRVQRGRRCRRGDDHPTAVVHERARRRRRPRAARRRPARAGGCRGPPRPRSRDRRPGAAAAGGSSPAAGPSVRPSARRRRPGVGSTAPTARRICSCARAAPGPPRPRRAGRRTPCRPSSSLGARPDLASIRSPPPLRRPRRRRSPFVSQVSTRCCTPAAPCSIRRRREVTPCGAGLTPNRYSTSPGDAPRPVHRKAMWSLRVA